MTRYGDIARGINGLRSPHGSTELHGTLYFPLRRESRMLPLDLYARVRFFSCICTRDRGCSAHPAFPAPSDMEGVTSDGKPRANGAARSPGSCRSHVMVMPSFRLAAVIPGWSEGRDLEMLEIPRFDAAHRPGMTAGECCFRSHCLPASRRRHPAPRRRRRASLPAPRCAPSGPRSPRAPAAPCP